MYRDTSRGSVRSPIGGWRSGGRRPSCSSRGTKSRGTGPYGSARSLARPSTDSLLNRRSTSWSSIPPIYRPHSVVAGTRDHEGAGWRAYTLAIGRHMNVVRMQPGVTLSRCWKASAGARAFHDRPGFESVPTSARCGGGGGRSGERRRSTSPHSPCICQSRGSVTAAVNMVETSKPRNPGAGRVGRVHSGFAAPQYRVRSSGAQVGQTGKITGCAESGSPGWTVHPSSSVESVRIVAAQRQQHQASASHAGCARSPPLIPQCPRTAEVAHAGQVRPDRCPRGGRVRRCRGLFILPRDSPCVGIGPAGSRPAGALLVAGVRRPQQFPVGGRPEFRWIWVRPCSSAAPRGDGGRSRRAESMSAGRRRSMT
ncbi:hypothetical protein E143388_07643 [Rhodococcus opacus]|nr:hypothetical protein E143388_07643 [Rhodococcus opacus]